MKTTEIIAEIGVNYYDISQKFNISLIDAVKKMIFECKKSGVETVKFQTYKADKLASEHSPSYWDLNEEPLKSQKELFAKFDKLEEPDYKEIADYCKEMGVEFMSTPFDFDSADFINKLVSRHKIASADITNYPLLERIANYGKPVILSTGASYLDEIVEAVDFLKQNGCKDLTILHCVLSYPTALENANLWKIQSLKMHFPECKIGFSDHSKFSLDILTTAFLLGAEIIEKHFTLDKNLKGNDHYHAGDPDDFEQLLNKIRFVNKISGVEIDDWLLECEKVARRNARRGGYLNQNVKKGEKLTKEHVAFLRPQLNGLSPGKLIRYIENNAVYTSDINKITLLTKDHLTY